MKAVILAIGDELILGQKVDTNSAWLSAKLAELGVMTLYHKTVADDLEATVAALKEACKAANLVIATGGLGPTADDLTRQAIAGLIKRPLDLHPPSLDRIKAYFKTLQREMPASNRVQALIPRGCEALDNDWGTAPGIKAEIGKTLLFAFPGVPYEMTNMATRDVFPLFKRKAGHALAMAILNTFGAGESVVAEKLGDLMRRDRNPLVGTTVSGGIVTVRIRSESPSVMGAQKNLETTLQEVKARLGNLVYGCDDETLAGKVVALCEAKGRRLALAESCTGGLMSKMLTDIPGSSKAYVGGWVVYSNAMKTRELGVPADLIDQEGAVSEAVACAMAEGALRHAEADLAVSLTGIAGPEGGTGKKPVGMVWIGMASREKGTTNIKAECFRYPGTREMIRDRAAKTALNLLRLELQG